MITVKLSTKKANSNIKLLSLNHVKRWIEVSLSLWKKNLIKSSNENKKDIPIVIFAMSDDLKSFRLGYKSRTIDPKRGKNTINNDRKLIILLTYLYHQH